MIPLPANNQTPIPPSGEGQAVEALLRFAATIGASAVHITVGAPPLLRLGNDLWSLRDIAEMEDEKAKKATSFLSANPAWGIIMTPTSAWRAVAEIFTRPDLRERFERTGTTRFVRPLPGLTRYLVTVFRQRGNPAIVCRSLGQGVPSLEDLFRHLPEAKDTVERLLTTGAGLVLVASPPGGGRDTTLAAMIDFINRTSLRHVVTIEAPIRYLHRHSRGIVNQREVGEDVESFESGVKAAAESDADVIAVGDVPDAGTADALVAAAEGGRLVLCAVRAASAEEAVRRIADLLPENLGGGPARRLVPVLRGVVVQKAVPSPNGRGTVVAAGVLPAAGPLGNALLSGDSSRTASLLRTGPVDGAFPLERSLAKLAASGAVSRTDAESRAGDVELFWHYLKLY
ncbi:MAG: type IV pilus twitching motility protein PilT [Moorellaceae bacterium]